VSQKTRSASSGPEVLAQYETELDAAFAQARETGDLTVLTTAVRRWWIEALEWQRDPDVLLEAMDARSSDHSMHTTWKSQARRSWLPASDRHRRYAANITRVLGVRCDPAMRGALPMGRRWRYGRCRSYWGLRGKNSPCRSAITLRMVSTSTSAVRSPSVSHCQTSAPAGCSCSVHRRASVQAVA
jgi:hypothetical protein